MSACLSRRSFLSEQDRLALLFLTPSVPSTLVQQMQVFEFSVQQTIWVQSYGQQIVLNVSFLNGEPEQKEKVRTVINSLLNDQTIVNVVFQFIEVSDMISPAHIRITFYENEYSWSFLGTEAVYVPDDLPTMNLSDSEQSTILHQFAHALGFPHEHEYSPIPVNWNREIVNKVFARAPHFWNTQDKMRDNFYDIFNVNQFYNYRSFRPTSMMVNVFPCSFFENNVSNVKSLPCDITLPDMYSKDDIQFFKSYYPKLENVPVAYENASLPFDLQVINNQLTSMSHYQTRDFKWTMLLVVLFVIQFICILYLMIYKR